MKRTLILALLVCFSPLLSEHDLMQDLLIVDAINCKLNDHLPVTYNNFLQGGYINMPSARMSPDGEIGAGFTYLPPYRIYNLRVQYYDRIEFSGNYRIFGGVCDPNLSSFGFGDFSDKGVNVKVAFLFPEESGYKLPGISFGWDDFLGTKAFEARYLVLTQVFPQYHLEATLGWGDMRLGGWFGGFAWMPWRHCCTPFATTQFLVEYDTTRYKSKKYEPHPKGHKLSSPVNVGVKFRVFDLIDLSCGYVRGRTFSFSGSCNYNIGSCKGILPKICDPPFYRSPVNTEPLGCNRDDHTFVEDLFYAMRCQGFSLMETSICGNHLYIRALNQKWRYEWTVRNRLNHLMAYLIPSNIEKVVVIIDGPGFPMQQYTYYMDFVRLFAQQKMCPYELKVVTPLQNYQPIPWGAENLYYEKRCLASFSLWPKMVTFFGSAKGKFKYAWGAYASLDGYLFDTLWYSLQGSYTFGSNLDHVKDVDKLNPSQLINVRTDIVNYLKHQGPTLEEAYVQRNFNLCRGFFGKIAGGIFELMYGGVASEVLYYPVNSVWAWGIEGAWLKKRKHEGLGFTNKIRKLHGYRPEYVTFHGAQYFFNVYYNLQELDLDLQIKAGKFLANDWGGRFEVSRYFASGTRIFCWYTLTNGHDKVNGHTYYDKGVGISIPMDLFYKCSSKNRWAYGMSAWLRDVGQFAYTGFDLYNAIRCERERYLRY
jgi:hypothetical protein